MSSGYLQDTEELWFGPYLNGTPGPNKRWKVKGSTMGLVASKFINVAFCCSTMVIEYPAYPDPAPGLKHHAENEVGQVAFVDAPHTKDRPGQDGMLNGGVQRPRSHVRAT